MAYYTKPDYSRQLRQYSGTSAVFSGVTNILEKFSVKSIEIDTANALEGNALLFDGTKFVPGVIGSFGSGILQGLQLTYDSGLTYNVSEGSYRIGAFTYGYTGGSVTILSGETGGSRFDVVYITSAATALVRSGQTATNPSVPALSGGELEIGIILVPVNFTGGTGSTVIQSTSTTVFEFYNTGTGIQRLPNSTNAQAPGDFSFALSRNSIAYGQDSVALGYYSRASGNSQTVVGQYNTPNTTDLFIIGDGISDGSRSNAFNVTNSGDTYANKKLFVTNVEIETTGASNGQVLKFDGTKFKPQLETVTGVTSITGGTSIYSSITNNNIILKSLSGGSNIFLTESSGTIYVNVQLSGVTSSGVTDIQSVAAGGGLSIISGKTGNTFFLYPIQGSGGTQVILSNNRLVVFSDTSASTTGNNIGPTAGAAVFSGKVLNELRFRRLSSTTPSFLTVAESTGLNELVLFTSTPPITGSTNATGGTVGVLGTVANRNIIGRTLSGTNRISLTQASDVITINSPIEVQGGDIGALAIYRSTSPVLFSSFTSTNISGITVRLASHTPPLGVGISNSGITSTYDEITPQFFTGSSFTISGFNFTLTGNGIQTFVNSNNSASYIGVGNCCFPGASYSINAVFNVSSYDVFSGTGFTLYTSYTFTAESNTTRTYTIPDTRRNATFLMTEANQTINGIKNFTSGFTIGTSPITTPDVFLQGTFIPSTPYWASQNPYNTYSLFSDTNNRYVLGFGGGAYNNVVQYGGQEVFIMPYASEYIVRPINPLTKTRFSSTTQDVNLGNNGIGIQPGAVAITSSTLTVGKFSNIFIDDGTMNSGDTAVGVINKVGIVGSTGAFSDIRNKVVGTFNTFATSSNRAISFPDNPIVSYYYETMYFSYNNSFGDAPINKTRTMQLGHVNKAWAQGHGIIEGIDLYLSRPKLLSPFYNGYGLVGSANALNFTTHAAIFVERRNKSVGGFDDDVIGRLIMTSTPTFTNAPWSLFAEGDRAYIGNTLALYSALTLTSTTRGAWLDIGPSQPTRPHINFASGGTAPTTPRIGDLWFDGTVLRFRLSSSTVNLTSGTSITGGSIGSSEGVGVAVYKTTVGDTLQFRSLSSTTDSSFLSISTSGDLILFSAGTALRGLSALTGSSLENLVFSSVTSSGSSLFDIPAPYKIYYKNLSGGTGIRLSESSSLITINQTVSGTTIVTGLTKLGAGSVQILHDTITNNNIIHRTLSAGTNTSISYAPDGTIVIRNTGVSGNTSFTGITDIVSAGTGNYSVISSVTDNKLVYRTLSAGTGMQITESNGTLVFVSTVTGGTGSGVTGNFVPLTGTTSGSPMQGNLVFSGTNGIIVDDGISRNSLTATGLTFSWPSTNNSLYIQANFLNNQSNQGLFIPDTTTGNGYIATVPNIAGQANKLIKVKSDETGFDFFEGYTYIDLVNAQTATGLTVGSWYRIPVSSRSVSESVNFNTYGDIMLLAVDTNKFSPDSYLLAINADYNANGDYTDVIDFNTYQGVPKFGQAVGDPFSPTVDIVIWNNRHWSTNYGNYTLTTPNDITLNLLPLTKDYTTRNGYIIEPQKIIYDVSNDTINRMEDKRGNSIINNNYIENFRFGDNNIYNNDVSVFYLFDIINYPILNFAGNTVKFGTIPSLTNLVPASVTLNITYCTIQDYLFTNDFSQSLYLSQSLIQDNKIYGQRSLTVTSSTITLPMLTNGQGWVYEQGIVSTGGTFNGIITAITQENQITNYYQKFRFINNIGSTTDITFRNSSLLKTEGGLDAVIKQGDDIEFYLSGAVAYQKDINNYV